jgi:hypothetical protein
VIRLGKHIAQHAAKEIAQVKRGAILKGEAGIGRKRKDLSFDEARKKFEALCQGARAGDETIIMTAPDNSSYGGVCSGRTMRCFPI